MESVMNVEASRRAIALDTESGQLPEGLLLPPEHGGEVVILLVDPELRGWAPEAAHALARGWTARGRRVVLVDGDFTGAILPLPQGGTHAEGVSDALFFGASPHRISLELPGEEHTLVGTGTVVPDPAQAWAHDGWTALLGRFRESGHVILLLLPANREGVTPLLPLANRTFRVARTLQDAPRPLPLLHPSHLRPLLADGLPLEEGLHELEAQDTEEVEGVTRADQGTLAEKPEAAAFRDAQLAQAARFRGSEGGPAAAGGAGGEMAASAPAPAEARAVRPRRVPWVLLVLVLVFVVALVLSWTGVVEIPGLPLPTRVDPAG
jgi:hypothetical protein